MPLSTIKIISNNQSTIVHSVADFHREIANKKGKRCYAVLKDNELTIKFDNSFLRNLFHFVLEFLTNHKNTFFQNKKIFAYASQLPMSSSSPIATPPTVTVTNANVVAQEKLKISQKAPQTALNRSSNVIPTIKPETYEQIRKKLLGLDFQECPRGSLPPHLLGEQRISMKPPRTMDYNHPPRLPYPESPQAEPAYQLDPAIEKLPPKEQIQTFLGYVKDRYNVILKNYETAQSLYKKLIETRHEQDENYEEDLRNFETILPTSVFFYLNQHVSVIKQLAEKYKTECDASAELSEALKIFEISTNIKNCHQEAGYYLRAYSAWSKNNKKNENFLAPPLDTTKEYPTFEVSSVPYYLSRNFDHLDIDKDHCVTMWPRDYHSIGISKENSAGKWELVPIFIKNDENDDRYRLKFVAQPGGIYRIDFGDVVRIPYSTTKAQNVETFFIIT